MIDYELLESGSNWGREMLLSGLLSHPHISLLRYSDGGPPESVDRKRLGSPWDIEYCPGWVEVMPPRNPTGEVQDFVFSCGGTPTRSAAMGDFREFAIRDIENKSYVNSSEPEARNRRCSDALALEVARTIPVDLYITRRPYLVGETRRPAADGIAFLPEDALPMIGLYLRRQGEFMYFRTPDGVGTYGCNEGLYYLTASVALLPEAWRWSSACSQYAGGVGDESLSHLVASLFQRVQRALQARDEMYFSLSKPQSNDTADSALGSLDSALILMMAAVDVVARVAHTVLGVGGKPHAAGWQSVKWVERLGVVAPGLASVVGDGTDVKRSLLILRKLRNSVHGEALAPLALHRGREIDRMLVGLPREDMREILEAIDGLGGRNLWGVESHVPDRLHIGPGILVENIFAHTFSALNDLMREMPVEALSHVQLKPSDCVPPQGNRHRFSEMKLDSVRWQVGL
ncbi:hypothetical protein ACFVVX_26730 [Kitasatospora sp. NPDC058170]|uniref:hypothetical protein n=1 Tax=Kitasatospora sp. NPDC058170 TaxID=3346364 RepID=UPI0036DB8294